MVSPVRYRIVPRNPAAHLFEVSVTVDYPDPAGQCFSLPAWIPGSYMIREFAKNIVSLRATMDGEPLACKKTDKATWRCAPGSGAITLTYDVYAWDLGVRGAHLDESHAFFNGSSVFLLPAGFEDAPCEVEIDQPDGERYLNWRVATALKQTLAPAQLAGQNAAEMPVDSGVLTSKQFGKFVAENYDELIDHPVEMGTFTYATFDACGVCLA